MIELAVVVLYLAIGTAYARQRTEQGKPTTPRPEFRVLTEREAHERDCDLLSRYREGECTCEHKQEWLDAVRTVRAWDRQQVPPRAREVYERLLFWPLLIHHALMSPPVGKETRRERRMRHELENARHIATVTAIAQGNQEAIAEAMNPLTIEGRP